MSDNNNNRAKRLQPLLFPSPIAIKLEGDAADMAREMDRLYAEAARLRAQIEQRQDKTPIQLAIERYERLHKQDRKITLKQVCEEMGVNYGSTRALKSRYAKQKRKRNKG